MIGGTGQHITVKMVMWLPAFLSDKPEGDCHACMSSHLRATDSEKRSFELRSCGDHTGNYPLHPYMACATLPSGENAVLACFSFRKSS